MAQIEKKHEKKLRTRLREAIGNIVPDMSAITGSAPMEARDGVIKTVKYGDPTVRYRQDETHKAYKSAAQSEMPMDPMLLNDLFYSAYLPYAGVKTQNETSATPLHRAIVDAVNNSEYIDRLRRASLGNITTSTAAATELANVLVSELQNAAEKSNDQQQRQAAQQLLQALQRDGKLGEDLAEKEQKMQEKKEKQQQSGQKSDQQNGNEGGQQGQSGQQQQERQDQQQQQSKDNDQRKDDQQQKAGQQNKDQEKKPDDQKGESGGKSKLPFKFPFGLPFGKSEKDDQDKDDKKQDQQQGESGQGDQPRKQSQQQPGQQSGQQGGQQPQQGQSGQQQQGEGEQSQSGQEGQQQGGESGGSSGQGSGQTGSGQSDGEEQEGSSGESEGGQGGQSGENSTSESDQNSESPQEKKAESKPESAEPKDQQNHEQKQSGSNQNTNSGSDGSGGSSNSKMLKSQFKPHRQPTKQEQEEIEKQMEMFKDPAVRSMLQNMVKQTASASAAQKAEEINKIQEVLNSDPYGGGIAQGTGSSYSTGANIDEVLQMANNADIMSILDVLKTIPAMKMPTKRKHTEFNHGDILDIRYTSDPEKARPAELALPDEIFMQKMSSGELAAYRHGVKERSTGPIYALIDKSGSMAEVATGGGAVKITWAKAVAVKLFQMAKRERKDFYVRFFDDSTYDRITSPRKEKNDRIRIIKQLSEVKATAGTDIQAAIYAACNDIISKGVTGIGEIILITDGGAYIDRKQTQEMLLKAKARLICIMIEGGNSDLKALSAGYMTIDQMTGQNILRLIEIRKKLREEEETQNRGMQNEDRLRRGDSDN